MTDTADPDFEKVATGPFEVERVEREDRVEFTVRAAAESASPATSISPISVSPMSAASRGLIGDLDVLANVAELARLVVPRLGSWSIVSVVDRHGDLRDVGSWHADERHRDEVAAYSGLRLESFGGESFVAQARRTGEVVAVADDAYAAIRQRLRPGAARDLLDVLSPRCVVVLPMVARGRTVGLLSVYGEAPWSGEQRATAEDIAVRAALVIDNSLSYERERRARAEAEAAQQRLVLLSQVSDALAGSGDPDQAVGTLAGLVVPALADWAFVTVINDDGSLSDIGIAHRDPAKYADLAAYSAVHLQAMSEDAAVSRALRTAAPVIVPQLREEILTSFLPDPWVAELTRRLAPHGVASFPLTARGRTLGAITLATTASRGPHSEDELSLGLEISRRAGLVLDNARAAHRARSLAESMQQGMLAIQPCAPELQVATRYRTAHPDDEIGGDWYDAYALPGGSSVVAIGDVMGHDVSATAAMTQLRTLMRAVAWTLRSSPAEILTATDAASMSLGPATFATAVVAELDGVAADGSVDVRWSSAGHLPPLVLSPDGSVELLRGTTRDIPLGVLAGSVRHDQHARLAAGSTLLLYTDGLIERRDLDLETSLTGLEQAARGLAGASVDGLLDGLLARFAADSGHSDDVALLAVRVGAAVPEDPRPSQAAPVRLSFPPTRQAPSLAREFVQTHCAHLPGPTLDDLLVLVSELVTNAVRYGYPEYSLELSLAPDSVRVAVHDDGPELLVRHDGAPDLSSPGGRGLLIVQALATAWGVLHTDGSQAKAVWFELPVGD